MESYITDAATATLEKAANVSAAPAFRDELVVEYQPVLSTSSMSSGLPRFGHSHDFSQLFIQGNAYNSSEARGDYIEGLLFAGMFVLVVFVAWSVLIFAFKLWGTCGFLSGRPFTLKEEEPTKDQLSKFHKKSSRKRIVFLVAGSVLITFSMLLISKGFQQVQETQKTADLSLDNIRLLIDDASVLAGDLKDVGLSAIDLRDTLVIELAKDRLCPQNPDYLAEDVIGKSINENAGKAIDMLDMLGEFATNDIQQMEYALITADNRIDDVDAIVEGVAELEWVGIAVVLPLVLFAAFMMAGTMAAQGQVLNNFCQFSLSWICLPLFILWVGLSYVFCAGLALSASANADFCSGGPDQTPDSTILTSIQNAGFRETDPQFQIARYYLRQCTADALIDPFLFLRQHQAEIISAKGVVNQLSKSIAKIDVDTLSFQCGRDFEPLSSSLDTMMAILDSLEKSAVSGLNLLSCERIIPIYADVVYEGTCNHSVTGFTWSFCSLLITSTMGMIMIMLRSSYQHNAVLTDVTDEDSIDQLQGGFNPRADLDDTAYALQLREHNRWKEEVVTPQDTSDSGSVYTDGNGDLVIYEVDPPVAPTNFYNRHGIPMPTAPVEPQY